MNWRTLASLKGGIPASVRRRMDNKQLPSVTFTEYSSRGDAIFTRTYTNTTPNKAHKLFLRDVDKHKQELAGKLIEVTPASAFQMLFDNNLTNGVQSNI